MTDLAAVIELRRAIERGEKLYRFAMVDHTREQMERLISNAERAGNAMLVRQAKEIMAKVDQGDLMVGQIISLPTTPHAGQKERPVATQKSGLTGRRRAVKSGNEPVRVLSVDEAAKLVEARKKEKEKRVKDQAERSQATVKALASRPPSMDTKAPKKDGPAKKEKAAKPPKATAGDAETFKRMKKAAWDARAAIRGLKWKAPLDTAKITAAFAKARGYLEQIEKDMKVVA